MTLVQRWNRLWFSEASPMALGVFRALFAVALWMEVDTTMEKGIFAVEGGGFHLPYADWIPLLDAKLFHWVHLVQYPLIVMLGIGLFARIAAGSLLVLQGWVFFADQLNFRNHPYFFVLLLALLTLARSDAGFSIRSLWRARRRGVSPVEGLIGSRQPLTIHRLIQFEVALVYVYAGLHKFNSGFLGGHVLSYYAGRSFAPQLEKLFGGWWPDGWSEAVTNFAGSPSNMAAPSIFSAILEMTLPLALFSRRLRPWFLPIGVAFHLGIAFTMNIKVFSLAMIGSYVLFIEPETLPRLARRLDARLRRVLGSRPASAQHEVRDHR